jgi:hypothetical protein
MFKKLCVEIRIDCVPRDTLENPDIGEPTWESAEKKMQQTHAAFVPL